MAKSRTIRVTPNLQKCLEELKEAVKTMPAGNRKKRAEGAIRYLNRTFKGQKQPGQGSICPVHTIIIR